jgi:hypothetical protein
MKFQISLTLPYIQHIFILCFNEYLAWWLLGPKHVAITTTKSKFCKRLLILRLNYLHCLLKNKSIYDLPFKTSNQFVCSRHEVCGWKPNVSIGCPRGLRITTAIYSLTLRPINSNFNGQTDSIMANGILETNILCSARWPETTAEIIQLLHWLSSENTKHRWMQCL